ALSLAEDHALHEAIAARIEGDRTGVCVAVAVIEKETRTAFVCADPEHARAIDEHTTFEIGSVTKTMTSALLAELVLKGAVKLDDPLASLLPKGTRVPEFDGQSITIKHVITHTSGLPALPGRMHATDPNNPYAALTPTQLLESLGDVKLSAAPGTNWA